MNLLFITLLLFALAFALHVIWWRVAPPRRQIPRLAQLFVIFFVIAFFLVWFAGHSYYGWLGSLTLTDWAMVGFLYVLISLCYLITFPAIEANSPTLSLMFALSNHAGESVGHEEVDRFLANFHFIHARVAALVADGFLTDADGLLKLTKRNVFFFRLIIFYRKTVLGLHDSGG